MILMKLFAKIKTKSSEIPHFNKTDVKSIFDNNGELYDTLSIDCSDDIEDIIHCVDIIDDCKNIVYYYD